MVGVGVRGQELHGAAPEAGLVGALLEAAVGHAHDRHGLRDHRHRQHHQRAAAHRLRTHGVRQQQQRPWPSSRRAARSCRRRRSGRSRPGCAASAVGEEEAAQHRHRARRDGADDDEQQQPARGRRGRTGTGPRPGTAAAPSPRRPPARAGRHRPTARAAGGTARAPPPAARPTSTTVSSRNASGLVSAVSSVMASAVMRAVPDQREDGRHRERRAEHERVLARRSAWPATRSRTPAPATTWPRGPGRSGRVREQRRAGREARQHDRPDARHRRHRVEQDRVVEELVPAGVPVVVPDPPAVLLELRRVVDVGRAVDAGRAEEVEDECRPRASAARTPAAAAAPPAGGDARPRSIGRASRRTRAGLSWRVDTPRGRLPARRAGPNLQIRLRLLPATS